MDYHGELGAGVYDADAFVCIRSKSEIKHGTRGLQTLKFILTFAMYREYRYVLLMAFRLLVLQRKRPIFKSKNTNRHNVLSPYGVGCAYVFAGAWSCLVAMSMIHVSYCS